MEHRTIVITGSTTGIGLGLAHTFLAYRCKIAWRFLTAAFNQRDLFQQD